MWCEQQRKRLKTDALYLKIKICGLDCSRNVGTLVVRRSDISELGQEQPSVRSSILHKDKSWQKHCSAQEVILPCKEDLHVFLSCSIIVRLYSAWQSKLRLKTSQPPWLPRVNLTHTHIHTLNPLSLSPPTDCTIHHLPMNLSSSTSTLHFCASLSVTLQLPSISSHPSLLCQVSTVLTYTEICSVFLNFFYSLSLNRDTDSWQINQYTDVDVDLFFCPF